MYAAEWMMGGPDSPSFVAGFMVNKYGSTVWKKRPTENQLDVKNE